MERLEVWVDDVALSAVAWGIEAGASVMAAPARRTGDVVVPGRHGVIVGVPDASFEDRDFGVSMYVLGTNPDGSIPATGTAQRAAFEANLSRLLNLVTRQGSPLTLRRKLPGRPAETAEARVVAAITPTVMAGRAGRVTVVFNLPRVFWVQPAAVTASGPLEADATLRLAPVFDGSQDVEELSLNVQGPTNGRVRVTDVATGAWIEAPRALAAGETWWVGCAEFASNINGVRAWPRRSLATRMWSLRSRVTPDGDQPVTVQFSAAVGGVVIQGRPTAL